MYTFKQRRMDRGKDRKGGEQRSIWAEVGAKGTPDRLHLGDGREGRRMAAWSHDVAVLRLMAFPTWKRLRR